MSTAPNLRIQNSCDNCRHLIGSKYVGWNCLLYDDPWPNTVAHVCETICDDWITKGKEKNDCSNSK